MEVLSNCMGKTWVCPFLVDDPDTEVGEVSTGLVTGCYFYQKLISNIDSCDFSKTKTRNNKMNKFVKKGGRV